MLRLILSAVFLFAGSGASAQDSVAITPEMKTMEAKLLRGIGPETRAWIRTNGIRLRASKTLSPRLDAQAWNTLPGRPAISSYDVEALAFLVLMEAAKSAREDLKSVMAQVKTINSSKAALRESMQAARESARKDTIDELGEQEQLRLQMAMDRKSQLEQMLSNLMKKASDTQSSITRNLK